MKIISSSSHQRGFTLIELLIVIMIIVILSAISMGGYGYVTRKQADSKATIQIGLLSKALEEYKLDNGEYPPSGNTNSIFRLLYWNGTSPNGKIYLSDLDPNSKKQGWIDGTGPASKIVDPWAKEYVYRRGDNPASKNPDFDLASAGQDGIANTTDDIDNY